jgi:hypothetical protein
MTEKSREVRGESTAEAQGESTADARDDWWHVIAATPLAIVAGGLVGGAVGGLIVLGFGVLYPFALRGDAKWVAGTPADWNPDPNTYTAIGLAVFPLTLGVLSFVVSPIYLYLRHTRLE